MPTFSSVVGRNVKSQPNQVHQQMTKLRQSMVAAVYLDQRDKDRRAGSFIISGLPTSTAYPDKVLVSELCSEEFNVKIDIISIKRLGKLSSPSSSSNKIQPLLVHVKNPDNAKLILSSARKLRRSTVPFVCENVYINPNLTKAEADAAYELRCRRREANSAPTESVNLHANPATNPNSKLSADSPVFQPSKN
jgi:hypothetical protein